MDLRPHDDGAALRGPMSSSSRLRTTQQGPSPFTSLAGPLSYAISIDTLGKLRWSAADINGDHLICVVSERAPGDYLAMLGDRASPTSFQDSPRSTS